MHSVCCLVNNMKFDGRQFCCGWLHSNILSDLLIGLSTSSYTSQHTSRGDKSRVLREPNALINMKLRALYDINHSTTPIDAKGHPRSHVSLTPPSPLDHFATALKGYCIPGSSGPHSCPHSLALFNTGLHSLNSKLNPPSGLLGMTDMVNIVESVCQNPGRPALPEQETHSQNIVLRWKMRPGTTEAREFITGTNIQYIWYNIYKYVW